MESPSIANNFPSFINFASTRDEADGNSWKFFIRRRRILDLLSEMNRDELDLVIRIRNCEGELISIENNFTRVCIISLGSVIGEEFSKGM